MLNRKVKQESLRTLKKGFKKVSLTIMSLLDKTVTKFELLFSRVESPSISKTFNNFKKIIQNENETEPMTKCYFIPLNQYGIPNFMTKCFRTRYVRRH